MKQNQTGTPYPLSTSRALGLILTLLCGGTSCTFFQDLDRISPPENNRTTDSGLNDLGVVQDMPIDMLQVVPDMPVEGIDLDMSPVDMFPEVDMPPRDDRFEGRPIFYATKTTTSILVDGIRDAAYDQAQSYTFRDSRERRDPNTVTISALWDEQNLFVFYEIEDKQILDKTKEMSEPGAWLCDAVELRVDPERDQSTELLPDDRLAIINWPRVESMAASPRPTLFMRGDMSVSSGFGAQHGQTKTTNGYTIEIALSWSEIGKAPTPDLLMGAMIAAGDCDFIDENTFKQFSWIPEVSNFQNPSLWGAVKLVDP